MAEVTEAQLSHRILQLSIFLPHQIGALLRLTRLLEAQNINVLALSILDSADHAVVRMVVDRPTLAAATIAEAGYGYVESELLGVALPRASGVRQLLKALLMAELNILYLYSVIESNGGLPVMAVHLDDLSSGARVLTERGFRLINHDELG